MASLIHCIGDNLGKFLLSKQHRNRAASAIENMILRNWGARLGAVKGLRIPNWGGLSDQFAWSSRASAVDETKEVGQIYTGQGTQEGYSSATNAGVFAQEANREMHCRTVLA